MLSQTGSVVGIDVGYSTTRRSSAVCRLEWTGSGITWDVARYRAIATERRSTYESIIGGKPIQAVAVDGPLRTKFEIINSYRCAERMLTRGMSSIGKPGQSNSPVGRKLNIEANACARDISSLARIQASSHVNSIDERCIVEAFPSSFLGLMLLDPSIMKCTRRNRSDVFFQTLEQDETLASLLAYFLPGRTIKGELDEIRNHDDRAAFVCAVTALGVRAGDFCAVGDKNGWIMLPPRKFIQKWAWRQLQENSELEVHTALFSSNQPKRQS